MEIRSTTIWETWNASPSGRTENSTPTAGTMNGLATRNLWKGRETRRNSGIDQTKAGHGTANMPSGRWQIVGLLKKLAKNAALRFLRIKPTPNSAERLAKASIRSEGTPSTPFASNAKSRSGQTDTGRTNAVRALAPASKIMRKAAVFNLTVDGEHEFFANGVLVHNCDAAAGAHKQLAGGFEPWSDQDIIEAFDGEPTPFEDWTDDDEPDTLKKRLLGRMGQSESWGEVESL
jgi:hypothetical protein